MLVLTSVLNRRSLLSIMKRKMVDIIIQALHLNRLRVRNNRYGN